MWRYPLPGQVTVDCVSSQVTHQYFDFDFCLELSHPEIKSMNYFSGNLLCNWGIVKNLHRYWEMSINGADLVSRSRTNQSSGFTAWVGGHIVRVVLEVLRHSWLGLVRLALPLFKRIVDLHFQPVLHDHRLVLVSAQQTLYLGILVGQRKERDGHPVLLNQVRIFSHKNSMQLRVKMNELTARSAGAGTNQMRAYIGN